MRGQNVAIGLLGRLPLATLPGRARIPRTLRGATPAEHGRGVVAAYSVGNFTVYRALIDRLRNGEKIRMETTNYDVYEFSRAEFYEHFPAIAASESFRVGPPTSPDACHYVVGPPPAAATRFKVPR